MRILDIIIPVYNEADNIIQTFNAIRDEIHCELCVYVVYDRDDDNTIPVVQKCIREEKYTYSISLMKNKSVGVLQAIVTGLYESENEYKLVMMADLSDKLDVVDEMVAKMEEGYDVVCGSRYMKGGKKHGGPVLKSFLSRMAGLTLHLLTGLPTHDCTNSFKMYSRRLLDQISIESSGGFEIGLEILSKAYIGGYGITEVPSEWYDRTAGKSNFHMWRWLPHYLHWYINCLKHRYTCGLQ